MPISIHAPSRERQTLPSVKYFRLLISIHAPSRERLYNLKGLLKLPLISIHAPSRERLRRAGCSKMRYNFNPRSLTGATYFNIFNFCPRIFQSTLPHGSDVNQCFATINDLNFNPRSLTGATRLSPRSCSAGGNFNPRSLTGATRPKMLRLPLLIHFNPRSLTGATGQRRDFADISRISIHAPSRERLLAGSIW